jgi:hypothetical protein
VTTDGVGIGITGPNYTESVPIGKGPSVLQAEIIAIERCAQICLLKGYRSVPITLCTDSKGALQKLKSYSFNQKSIWTCRGTLAKLAKDNHLVLRWTPSHSGIAGNTLADSLARQAAATKIHAPEPTCGLDKDHLRETVTNWEQKRKSALWLEATGMRQAKMLIHPSAEKTKKLLLLTKGEIRQITGLLTGHYPIRYHLHKMGKAESPTCRMCGKEDETVLHILCECEKLAAIRTSMVRARSITAATISGLPPRELLNLVKRFNLSG